MNIDRLAVYCEFLRKRDLTWERDIRNEIDRIGETFPVRNSYDSNETIDILLMPYLARTHDELSTTSFIRNTISTKEFYKDPNIALIACGHDAPEITEQDVESLWDVAAPDRLSAFTWRVSEFSTLRDRLGELIEFILPQATYLNNRSSNQSADASDDLMQNMIQPYDLNDWDQIARMRRL